MKKLTKCPICKSKKFNFLFSGSDRLFEIPGKFQLMTCKSCNCNFLNPQPTQEELKKYYPEKKYNSLKKIDKSSKRFNLKLLLYEIYFSKKNNYFLKFLFSFIKYSIRGTIIKKELKLLDIGCGSGQFLYEMKVLGLKVYGIEPGEFNEKESKKEKLNIKKGFLEKGLFKKNNFDLITMNHVLEHINNPLETIREIKHILKEKGLLIIGVPNTRSLASLLFGKNWLAHDVPRHLINYSNKNLSLMLKKEGLKIKKIRYNSRPAQFVMSIYFTFGVKKREGFANRVLEIIFLPLTWIANLLKQGDQIEIWCEK